MIEVFEKYEMIHKYYDVDGAAVKLNLRSISTTKKGK